MSKKNHRHWTKSSAIPAFTLSAPDHNEEFVVMEGGDLGSLSFGPYRSSESYYPSSSGTVVIHGNSHLNFLKDINLNDQIIINDNMGSQYNYVVEGVGIIDLEEEQVEVVEETEELKLLTTWPFGLVDEQNSLRFMVTAKKDESDQN